MPKKNVKPAKAAKKKTALKLVVDNTKSKRSTKTPAYGTPKSFVPPQPGHLANPFLKQKFEQRIQQQTHRPSMKGGQFRRGQFRGFGGRRAA